MIEITKRIAVIGASAFWGASGLVLGTAGSVSAQSAWTRYQSTQSWTNVGVTPHFSGVDPSQNKVFVSNLAAGTLTILNSDSGRVISTLQLGGTLHTVMVDQKNQRVYVTDIARGLLDVVNAQTDSLVAEIPVASHLHGLAVSQRLHEAFVTDVSLSRVYAVDLNSNTVLDPQGISVGPNPWGVTVNSWTRMVYVANTGIDPFAQTPTNPQGINPSGDSVSIISLASMKVVDTVVVGPHPWNVIADPYNDTVYTGVSGANEVAVIKGGSVTGYIAVGASPHGEALDAKRGYLFVNNSASNNVTVINSNKNRVLQTIPVGLQPQGISVNPRNGTAYVVDQASASVTVLSPERAPHPPHKPRTPNP